MRIPATRERVRLEDREGAFLVVWVDHDRGTADLIPLGEGDVEDSVPFARIRPLEVDSDATMEFHGTEGMA
jgi:hypothetical protein